MKGGCEGAVHSARNFLGANKEAGLIKLDFKNAFNSVSRDSVLISLSNHLPELLRYVEAGYGANSILQFGEFQLESQEDVQQGDPLGPLLFSLAIRDVSHGCLAPFVAWFLDDCAIGGNAQQVERDYKMIVEKGHSVGLELNSSKCEILSDSPQFVEEALQFMPQAKVVQEEHRELLGAGITVSSASRLLSAKSEQVVSICKELKSVSLHDAYWLLRTSAGAPRLNYLLRTSPCFVNKQILIDSDSKIRGALSDLFRLKLDDAGWAQSSISLSKGGLSLCSPAHNAIASFLSSCHASRPLCDQLVAAVTSHDDMESLAISAWREQNNGATPDPRGMSEQTAWLNITDDITISQMFTSAIDT